MVNLAVDPHLIALPDTPDSQTLAEYVDSLLSCTEIMRFAWVNLSISEETEAAAVTDGRYPIYEQLARAISQAGIVDFDARTIATLVGRLMARIAPLEESLSIRDVAWGALEWILTDGSAATNLNYALAKTGVLLTIGQSAAQLREPFIVTSRVATPTNTRVRATDVLVEYQPGASGQQQQDSIEGEIVAVPSVQQFLGELDPVSFLALGSDVGIDAGVRLAIYQRAGGGELEILAGPGFALGTQFAQSLSAHHFDRARNARVLRACLETVLRENMAETHALRVGPGPGEPQQTRGTDLAWRRTIDYDYRLHYWERDSGGPEFASVAVHADATIPY